MIYRSVCAVFSLFMGVLLSMVAMFMPPVGEIHGSVLNLTAQLLVFSGACLGIEAYVRYAVDKGIDSAIRKRKGGVPDDAGVEK